MYCNHHETLVVKMTCTRKCHTKWHRARTHDVCIVYTDNVHECVQHHTTRWSSDNTRALSYSEQVCLKTTADDNDSYYYVQNFNFIRKITPLSLSTQDLTEKA